MYHENTTRADRQLPKALRSFVLVDRDDLVVFDGRHMLSIAQGMNDVERFVRYLGREALD